MKIQGVRGRGRLTSPHAGWGGGDTQALKMLPVHDCTLKQNEPSFGGVFCLLSFVFCCWCIPLVSSPNEGNVNRPSSHIYQNVKIEPKKSNRFLTDGVPHGAYHRSHKNTIPLETTLKRSTTYGVPSLYISYVYAYHAPLSSKSVDALLHSSFDLKRVIGVETTSSRAFQNPIARLMLASSCCGMLELSSSWSILMLASTLPFVDVSWHPTHCCGVC